MLASLPDAARLWLFVFDGPAAAVFPAVDAWLPAWASHGRPVTASAETLGERVLAVGARVATDGGPNAGVSGCGIDAMRHAVEAAAADAGRALVPALHLTWQDAGGAWQTTSRSAFRALVADGTVGPDTPVVDTTPETVGEARARGVVRPAAEAWTGRAFALAPAV